MTFRSSATVAIFVRNPGTALQIPFSTSSCDLDAQEFGPELADDRPKLARAKALPQVGDSAYRNECVRAMDIQSARSDVRSSRIRHCGDHKRASHFRRTGNKHKTKPLLNQCLQPVDGTRIVRKSRVIQTRTVPAEFLRNAVRCGAFSRSSPQTNRLICSTNRPWCQSLSVVFGIPVSSAKRF